MSTVSFNCQVEEQRRCQSARRCAFCLDATTQTLLGFLDEPVHRFLRDGDAVATCEGFVGFIKRGEEFEPPALALFPESECLLNRVLVAAEPAASIAFRMKAR